MRAPSLQGRESVARRAHRLAILVVLAMFAGGESSCAWPRVIGVSPQEPLFHSAGIVGGRDMDAALCSLGTLGPDAVSTVLPPEAPTLAISPAEACGRAWPAGEGQRGRAAVLVQVDTTLGAARGYLYGVADARGIIVAFSGLGMPADGWINQRFAEAAARRGLVTFAVVRDETIRPMRFDPLREARRAVAAVERLRGDCLLPEAPPVGFVGVSMGGLEALLAMREVASSHAFEARAAVIDPVLDFGAVASHLDAPLRSFPVDSMRRYFQRLIQGRYQEPPATSFRELLARTSLGGGVMTDPASDAPSAWLCRVDPDTYTVLVSDNDTVLGNEQRAFARTCGFPLLPARAPGHVPLACRPELFDEVLDRIEALPGFTQTKPLAFGWPRAPRGRSGRRACTNGAVGSGAGSRERGLSARHHGASSRGRRLPLVARHPADPSPSRLLGRMGKSGACPRCTAPLPTAT